MSVHGGNIHGFALSAGIGTADVIDFSASINPAGPSRCVIAAIKEHLRDIEHYPDPDANQLKKRLSAAYDLDGSLILCGNGCTELIYLLPCVMPFRKVLVPGPTFVEYERACMAASPECILIDHRLKEKDDFFIDPPDIIRHAAEKGADAVFLCNPNNPTGRLAEMSGLEEAASMAEKSKIYLIVDESFIEFTQAGSMTGLVPKNPYLIVLRSMTKFHALPGLRLGWGAFPSRIARELEERKQPWSVNALAQAAGIAALDESGFHDRTIRYIKRQKKLLEAGLDRLGIERIPSDANYYLLRSGSAQHIIGGLKEHNILVRDCSGFKGLDKRFIRIAVRKKKENEILLEHMARYV